VYDKLGLLAIFLAIARDS